MTAATEGVEVIEGENGTVLAIVVRKKVLAKLKETKFFTPADWTLQAGYVIHKAGESVNLHRHPWSGTSMFNDRQEVLFVVSGRVRVKLLVGKKTISVELGPGDFIVMSCPHGVEFLEDSVLFEVKEGPYPGKERDKEWLENG